MMSISGCFNKRFPVYSAADVLEMGVY